MIKGIIERDTIKWTEPGRTVWAELAGLGFARPVVTLDLLVELELEVG